MSVPRERILFVELWRLGDAISATAGLRALRLARPMAEIAVLAHSRHGEPLFRSADADHRFPFDAFWTRGKLPRDKYLPWTIDYGALRRAVRAVRAFRPHHVLLFRGDIREQLFFRAIGISNIVDLRGPLPMLPRTNANLRPEGVPRWQEYVSHIREWSGAAVEAAPIIHGISREPSTRPYLLLHPGASWRYKQWSATNVAAFIDVLEREGQEIRIVAGAADRAFIDEIGAARGEPLGAEYPSLDELYSLIAGARAVICNNSAALHIAEALGTPCVCLTGPSDPVRWGTYRPHSRTVIRSASLPCHPCGEKRCVMPSTPCIERIALADVLGALAEVDSSCNVKQQQIHRTAPRTAR
jgi:ADP-heptose:LPS heptosyltransferase